jgi:DNA polymerase-3 subunit gamma/tau
VRRDRPLISTWLEAGILLEVDAHTVRLGFPVEQRMAMESLMRTNNRSFLAKLFSQLTGANRDVLCEAREGLVVQPASLPAPPPEPAPADPMEAYKNDPLIRKALEIFQAEIQPA